MCQQVVYCVVVWYVVGGGVYVEVMMLVFGCLFDCCQCVYVGFDLFVIVMIVLYVQCVYVGVEVVVVCQFVVQW